MKLLWANLLTWRGFTRWLNRGLAFSEPDKHNQTASLLTSKKKTKLKFQISVMIIYVIYIKKQLEKPHMFLWTWT